MPLQSSASLLSRKLAWLASMGSACLLTSFTLAGCVVETRDNSPPPAVVSGTGTLTVDWTIDGRTDPNRCVQAVVDSIEITVYSTSGASVGTFRQACSSFATSITLSSGSYTASAVLIDSADSARTTTVTIPPFSLYGSDTVDSPVDFPASSFLE